MGNILVFLARYYKYILFTALEGFCLFLVVNFNNNQKNAFFSVAYDLSGRVSKTYYDVNSYFHLQTANDSLLAENARLRAMMQNSKWVDTSKGKIVHDTAIHQKFTYIPAKVVNNSVNIKNNYITLDIGENKGIAPHMGVVSTSGIVGTTRFVSSHFTTSLSVLHKDFKVYAEIKEIKEMGSLIWGNTNPEIAILKDIPIHIHIAKGQHVVVSPYSKVFPEGTPIGIIQDYKIEMGSAFYTIYVKLATNIRNVRQVYVVNNIMADEQTKLEKASELEDKE